MPKDLSGAQVGMSPSNNVNNPRPDQIRGRNIFPQSYRHLTTDRYGEYSPFYWAKCERGDVVPVNAQHDLHTFTMKSPMVSDVVMTKSYVKVPMYAIYPRNWEKMLTIPTQGDDVPSDTRAKLDVYQLVYNLTTSLFMSDSSGTSYISDGDFVLRWMLLESICSYGSLFSRFNIHLASNFHVYLQGEDGNTFDRYLSLDKISDTIVWPAIFDMVERYEMGIVVDDIIYKIGENPADTETSPIQYVSRRRFQELLRRNDFEFYGNDWSDESLAQTLFVNGGISVFNGFKPASDSEDRFINIEPIISYQLACAQFATNDFVDYIYSAQLYRDNMQSLALLSMSELPYFTYNGVMTLYDVFSQNVMDKMIRALDWYGEGNIGTDAVRWFLNLFSYVPSLRYGDYFTGAKPTPLAVGEYSAQVQDNSVSAIDVTRSIQMQRLLHRVNMVGRKIGDYLSGIFGGRMPEAAKDVPIFLAHQTFEIKGFETENTGAAQLDPATQNIITTNLRSKLSKHAFEIEIDEPCYVIGMNSYSTRRIYSTTIDRFAFHYDRYDDFIPEMQYIGDQDIRRSELLGVASSLPFGYCLRYMEYKQRYSYASGGFIENLPSWSFITDNKDGNRASFNIEPDYIRSSPSEFDRFYKSLTGYSLGSYFHFIVAHTIETAPARMMEYTPEILK